MWYLSLTSFSPSQVPRFWYRHTYEASHNNNLISSNITIPSFLVSPWPIRRNALNSISQATICTDAMCFAFPLRFFVLFFLPILGYATHTTACETLCALSRLRRPRCRLRLCITHTTMSDSEVTQADIVTSTRVCQYSRSLHTTTLIITIQNHPQKSLASSYAHEDNGRGNNLHPDQDFTRPIC